MVPCDACRMHRCTPHWKNLRPGLGQGLHGTREAVEGLAWVPVCQGTLRAEYRVEWSARGGNISKRGTTRFCTALLLHLAASGVFPPMRHCGCQNPQSILLGIVPIRVQMLLHGRCVWLGSCRSGSVLALHLAAFVLVCKISGFGTAAWRPKSFFGPPNGLVHFPQSQPAPPRRSQPAAACPRNLRSHSPAWSPGAARNCVGPRSRRTIFRKPRRSSLSSSLTCGTGNVATFTSCCKHCIF